MAVAGVVWADTPQVDDLQTRVAMLASSEGVAVLRPDAVPHLLARAIVDTEDETFYSNFGIDVVGLGRSALYDVAHLCGCQGGSTITGQLAKETYLGGSDAGLAKVVELTLGLKLALGYTKAQVLADYLSIIPTGADRFGMAAAACADFHRPLASLDLGEVALLAGLPQAPSAYDPLLHPREARERRQEVLSGMVAEGDATPAEAVAAAREPVTLPATPGGC
ncbi:MAG: biosynthetic peptidoglycan transglycosylase [Candidatus Limnocylindrales bacterium]